MTGEFVDCVRTGKRPVADGEAGLNVVRILEAAELSIRSGGRRVELTPWQVHDGSLTSALA